MVCAVKGHSNVYDLRPYTVTFDSYSTCLHCDVFITVYLLSILLISLLLLFIFTTIRLLYRVN